MDVAMVLYETNMKRTGTVVLPFERRDGLEFDESLRYFGGQASTAAGQIEVASDTGTRVRVNTFTNEFWTAKQRAAHSLHEVSYRACFKPQLPRFFIERLTQPGDVVYDPFMGRGTTPLEAALLGRVPYGSDINPLSAVLTRPRLHPPTLDQVAARLDEIDFNSAQEFPEELLVFYHPDTLKEIASLKHHLLDRRHRNALDAVD